MKPDQLSVYDLFQKERRYVVPLYQRAYVWNEEEQWEPLWQDIVRQADACLGSASGQPRRSHFLGAVVLNVQKIVGSSIARSEIIDGQQRLTTLQLFIAALRDCAIANGSADANKIRRLSVNEDEKVGAESSFKVWPTNADRHLFRTIMVSGRCEALFQKLNISKKADLPRLAGAYCFFYDQIDEYVSRAGPAQAAIDRQIFGLLQSLRAGLQIVVIELEDRDDPQIIFETLNARGQPLLPSDLIRNTIFHQASLDAVHSGNEQYADELYMRYWHAFDNDRALESIDGEDRYWHIEERQGRLNRPRIDLFIFHFLVMQTGRELAIGQIFQEFRDWRDSESSSLEEFLTELTRYASIFRALISPVGEDRASVFARRLRSLDTSTVYPFLLYILGLSNGRLSKDEKQQILVYLESWLIRRLICQLTNKNYNKFFVSLLSKAKQAEKDHLTANADDVRGVGSAIRTAIYEDLTTADEITTRWPTDQEFERGWLEKPIYVKSRPDRAVSLLRAIDAQMQTNRSEAVLLPDGLTVEHLLPQNGALSDYPLQTASREGSLETPELAREKLIHTMGNLTLLTGPLNSSVSNGPFDKKRPKIAENSALRLNARFQKPDQKTWLEQDIVDMGRELFTYAKEIWPRPMTTS